MNPNEIISSDYGQIIININDNGIGSHIRQYGYWANDDIDLIKLLVDFQLKKHETITFYDIGANIGTHSLAISKHSDKIKIRAFEAQRQIFNMLFGTMAINGITNVHCYNNAVSNIDNDIMEIFLQDYNCSNSFGSLELIKSQFRSEYDATIKASKEQIKTISIDSFNERVDFIKMDIEGMEDKALVGGAKTIEMHRPICFIEVLKTDYDFILNYFKKLNYIGLLYKTTDLFAIPMEFGLGINGSNLTRVL